MFNRPRKLLLAFALLLAMLTLSALPTYAITAASLTITGGADTPQTCGGTPNAFRIYVSANDITGTTDDSGGYDEFFIAIIDYTGKFVGSWIDNIPVGATQNFSVGTGNWNTVLGMSSPASRLVHAVLIDSPDVNDSALLLHLLDVPILTSAWFDIANLSTACGALPVPTSPQNPTTPPVISAIVPAVRPDARVNWQYGDLNAVIYDHEDGVVVYCYVDTAWLGMHITQEIVDAWDTTQLQDAAVLEVNEGGCHVAFYILDTGEYQINIWAAEGKRYEVIADNLNFTDAVMHAFDPNE